MSTIDFSKVPVEPTITIIDNHGKELITTNNPVAVLYARVEIKHLGLVGYRIRTKSGLVVPILSNGNLPIWPQGEIPGDVAESLLCELL